MPCDTGLLGHWSCVRRDRNKRGGRSQEAVPMNHKTAQERGESYSKFDPASPNDSKDFVLFP